MQVVSDLYLGIYTILPLAAPSVTDTELINQSLFLFQEIVNNDGYQLDNKEYNTKLLVIKAKRSQSGKYIITARNSVGEDVAELDLTVLGKGISLVKSSW